MRTKTFVLLASIAGSVATLSGCTTMVGNHHLAKTSRAGLSQELVRGKTTESQVRALMGDPTKTTFASHGGTLWTYSLMTARASAKNIALSSLTFGFMGRIKQRQKTVNMLFNRRKVLVRYSYSNVDSSPSTN